MAILDLAKQLFADPDDVDNHLSLEKHLKKNIVYAQQFYHNKENPYCLAYSMRFVEILFALIKNAEVSWNSDEISHYLSENVRVVCGGTAIYASNLHFGILTGGGWDVFHRINTPELLCFRKADKIFLEDAFVCCEQSVLNYGHFQVITMARIYQAIKELRNDQLFKTIVIDDDLVDFSKQLIESNPKFSGLRFVGARNKVVHIKGNTYLPTVKRFCMKQQVDLLDEMWTGVVGTPTSIGKRIYIERLTSANGSIYRNVVNTEDRDSWVEKNNFEIIFLESFHVSEKISIFRNAEYIVGVEGAGLLNIVHCLPGTNVVELHHEERGYLELFEAVGNKKQLNYKKLPCKTPFSKEQEENLRKQGLPAHNMPLICDFAKLSSTLNLPDCYQSDL